MHKWSCSLCHQLSLKDELRVAEQIIDGVQGQARPVAGPRITEYIHFNCTRHRCPYRFKLQLLARDCC